MVRLAPLCLPLFAAAVPNGPVADDAVGRAAPAIGAEVWVNHFGEPPGLEAYRGRPILVELWSVASGPSRGAWPQIVELFERHGPQGLAVVGLTEDPVPAVADHVELAGLPFPVGAASRSPRHFRELSGTDALPQAFLVAADGTILWHGHPSKLAEKTVTRALQGAAAPPKRPMLALQVDLEGRGAVEKAIELVRDGELAKALRIAEGVVRNEKAAEAERVTAVHLVDRVDGHVQSLLDQVELAFERRAMIAGRDALQGLADELRGHELGQDAAELLERLESDDVLSRELEAAVRYEELLEIGARDGMVRVRDRIEDLVDAFDGTRAATKAKAVLARL